MNWVLKRYGSTPMGTFGHLRCPDAGLDFKTVERPWLDNKPSVSCIPLGQYKLRWRETTTSVPDIFGGKTWYMDGNQVGIGPGYNRTNCAIHIGNTDQDVTGCIAVGMAFGTIDGRWGVISSRKALERLFMFADHSEELELSIVGSLMG